MHGHQHAISTNSLTYEENVSLLDDKSLSDIDSDAGRADLDSRFPSAREWVGFAHRVVTGLPSVPQKLPSRSACRALAVRALLFLLPSFVSSRLSHEHRLHRAGERLSPTAYLDGMRGLAAFIVFFCHYFYTSMQIAEGWGSNGGNYYVFKLPFLRLVYAGPPMVAIFFIISGYALSLKPVKLARGQKWTDFATTMSSFVFRRAIRLFLPTAISTLMIVGLLRVGAYEWNRDFSQDPTYHTNVQEIAPPRLDTLSEQLWDWAEHMFRFVHVWGWERYGGSTYYDVHLWTIPVEFRASMILFLVMVGLARLRAAVRLLVLFLVMWFVYESDRWEMLLFLAGMLFAELDVIRGAHTNPATCAVLQASQAASPILPTTTNHAMSAEEKEKADSKSSSSNNSQNGSSGSSRLSRLAWGALSIFALYLLSQPDAQGENTPGWMYLASLIPEWVADKYRYWQCNGAMLFVFCVARMPAWQRFFNSAPVQYLGRLSYAIYLMHGPVLHTVGYGIERWAWSVTGVEGWNYYLGFWLAAVFVVPCVVWAADVFWRAVDAPVVRFAKWFEGKCVLPPAEEHHHRGRPARS